MLYKSCVPTFIVGYSVQDVRDAVDQLRRGMTETTAGMKEAFNRGTDKLYHVITSNNRIVQFRYAVRRVFIIFGVMIDEQPNYFVFFFLELALMGGLSWKKL